MSAFLRTAFILLLLMLLLDQGKDSSADRILPLEESLGLQHFALSDGMIPVSRETSERVRINEQLAGNLPSLPGSLHRRSRFCPDQPVILHHIHRRYLEYRPALLYIRCQAEFSGSGKDEPARA